jgi:hypothetical protein
MRSPALAIVWEFRHRHRWGLTAIGCYLLGLASIKLLLLELAPGVDLAAYVGLVEKDDVLAGPRFAAVVVVPLTAAVTYLIAAFSFGLAGDLAPRQSIYPARMFTLPVTSSALAGWPMLYGAVAMASLWLATAYLALWPAGVDIPLVWPAVFAATFLAWTQVVTWMAYPVPGLRMIVAVLLLVVIGTVGIVAVELKPSESLMVAVFAPQLPLAFLAARAAIGRARRGDVPGGDVPDWRRAFARLGQASDALFRWRRPFSSPARAQVWYEWRQHGRSLPAWVGILLPFELALLFLAGKTSVFVLVTLLGVLLTPPVLAAFVAATVRKPSPLGSDGYGMATFIATRPMTSAALIAAKLRVAIWSTIAAWLLVAIAVPVALGLSGTWPIVVDCARQVRDDIGTPRTVVIALLGLAALVAATWKRLVLSLYIGLSGRTWLVRTYVGLTLAILAAIIPLLEWVGQSSDVRRVLWNSLPWVAAGLVSIKMTSAAWIATHLHRTELLTEYTLLFGAATWVVAVLALYALLAWIMATPHFPHYFLVLASILAIPLTRLSAAPLALAWNRHR